MQFLLEEPVFDEMSDADADPKVSLVSFGLLVSSIFDLFLVATLFFPDMILLLS